MRQRADVELEALYRRYRGDVYRYALRASRDENEADEVTQAAFLSAYRALVRGGSPRSPRAWLIAIAENVRRRRLRRPSEAQLSEVYEAAAPEPDVTAGELVAAIETLPEPQRRALVLRELAGRSYGEIASDLGTSVGSVQMLLFRARRGLRERLSHIAAVPAPFSVERWFGAGGAAVRAGAAATGIVVLAAGAGGDGPPIPIKPDTGLQLAAPATAPVGAPAASKAPAAVRGARSVRAEPKRRSSVRAPAAEPLPTPRPAIPVAPATASSPALEPAAPPAFQPPAPAPLPPEPLVPPAFLAPAPEPLPPVPLAPALPELPAPELPALPDESAPALGELPALLPTEVPAPPALPNVPVAPELPELRGAQLPQPSPPSRPTTAESARPLLP